MKDNIDVIVIGGNHHNTLGVVRSLGYEGISPILILVAGDDECTYVAHSRYLKKTIRIATDAEIVNVLLGLSTHASHKMIVIACSDAASSVIDLNRDILQASFWLPGCEEQGLVTKMMDKDKLTNYGRSVGFNVPRSWVVNHVEDIQGITYPCITKPILSKDGHKSDIIICHSKEELIKVLEDGSCYKYQVQEFIEKDFEYQLIGLSLNGGEIIIIPGISRCIRPCPGTNTGFLKYQEINTLNVPLDKCKDFISNLRFSGLFSIEFIRDKHGVDFFLEMNFRNDGNAICVTKSGFNLPYLWYLYCIGGDYKVFLSSCKLKPIYVMPELNDLYFVKSHEISLQQWLRDIKRTDAFMEYDSSDKLPFLLAVKSMLLNAIKRRIFSFGRGVKA